MRKLIVRFIAFLLIVGGLTTSFLIAKPKEVVKADTPSLYYFDIDTSVNTKITIILYVLDVANLQGDTCSGYLLVSSNQPPYRYATSQYNSSIQFLRYSQLDHDDYDAYIYNWIYAPTSGYLPLSIVLDSHFLTFDNNTSVSYDLIVPYYPTYDIYYQNGKSDGITIGENNMTHYWRDQYFAPDGDGYNQIYNDGKSYGYNVGYREGQESLDTMSWFQTITSGVSDVMDIHLLPSITIGTLIFIPFMFMVLSAVLWIWRHR